MFYKELLENYTRNPRTIVLSTHLIEEAASLLEEVVILHNGRIMAKASCEELLQTGYTVSGRRQEVEGFLQGRKSSPARPSAAWKRQWSGANPARRRIPWKSAAWICRSSLWP